MFRVHARVLLAHPLCARASMWSDPGDSRSPRSPCGSPLVPWRPGLTVPVVPKLAADLLSPVCLSLSILRAFCARASGFRLLSSCSDSQSVPAVAAGLTRPKLRAPAACARSPAKRRRAARTPALARAARDLARLSAPARRARSGHRLPLRDIHCCVEVNIVGRGLTLFFGRRTSVPRTLQVSQW